MLDELADDGPGGLPRARPRRPGLRGVLPRHHADRRAVRPAPRLAAGGPRPAAGRTARRRLDRRPAGDPVGVRLVPVADQPARLVRPRVGAGGLPGGARRGGPGRDRPAVPRVAVLRVGPRQRRDDPGQGRHGRRPALRRRSRATRTASRRWAAIEAEYHRTVALLLRVTGRDAPARRRAGPAALDRPAQPVRRLAVRAPGPAARAACGRCRRTTRSAAACCGSSS